MFTYVNSELHLKPIKHRRRFQNIIDVGGKGKPGRISRRRTTWDTVVVVYKILTVDAQ